MGNMMGYGGMDALAKNSAPPSKDSDLTSLISSLIPAVAERMKNNPSPVMGGEGNIAGTPLKLLSYLLKMLQELEMQKGSGNPQSMVNSNSLQNAAQGFAGQAGGAMGQQGNTENSAANLFNTVASRLKASPPMMGNRNPSVFSGQM